jgi:cell division protein FtsZ
MGTATARGENALVEAARNAINCTLLEDGGVKGARGILINITGSSQLSLHDVNEACALIRAAAEYEDVQINFGIVLNEDMGDEVKITVIATGFQRSNLPTIERGRAADESRMIAAASQALPAPMPMEQSMSLPVSVTIEETDPIESEIEIATTPTMASVPEEQKNDLDMPAFLRRERRLFQ